MPLSAKTSPQNEINAKKHIKGSVDILLSIWNLLNKRYPPNRPNTVTNNGIIDSVDFFFLLKFFSNGPLIIKKIQFLLLKTKNYSLFEM